MQDETDFAEPSPWTRPWFLIAAGFLALVVVLGVAVVLWPSKSLESAPAPGPVTTVGSGQPTAGASALPTATPTTGPSGVTWQLAGQSAVPVSDTAGPRTVSGGTASGYAHTPDGALIAAAQTAARAGFSAGKESWEPTVEKRFVPSGDRDRLLSALRSQPAQPAQPGELSPLAGFIYQAYTPDTAVIGLVYRAPGGGPANYHVVTTTMQWHDSDWKMVAPPGGSWLSVSRQATGLAGVVEWGNR
jgi:hypothetical protein